MKKNKLNDYTKDMLREYISQGTDAATYFVQGDDDEPPAHIEEILNRASVRRVYPMDGGHLWMVPYGVVKGHEALFGKKEKTMWYPVSSCHSPAFIVAIDIHGMSGFGFRIGLCLYRSIFIN